MIKLKLFQQTEKNKRAWIAIFIVPMKAQSHLWLWQFGSYLRYGMLSSCICSTPVSVCAMKGILIGPLVQWGKDLTYYLTSFFCLVNWDMHYPILSDFIWNVPYMNILMRRQIVPTKKNVKSWNMKLKVNIMFQNSLMDIWNIFEHR